MASGYGIRGGPSRCFVFWQEVMGCYVMNTSGDDNKGAEKCIIPLSDYLECLHHKKEGERVQQIQTAYRKWEAENADFVAKNAKDVRSLGVIEATMEEKNLKIPKWMPHVKRN